MVSAKENASTSVSLRSVRLSKRSLGITISVSTACRNCSTPVSATRERFAPSTRKGLVTTATVRASSSREAAAMSGLAPVPVPPPMPAVMNTISAPSSAILMSWMLSSAAWRPSSGFPPAPRPRVVLSPIWIFRSALDSSRTWLSVLIARYSTPMWPASIMRLTALPPAPPTPTTRILANSSTLGLSIRLSLQASAASRRWPTDDYT